VPSQIVAQELSRPSSSCEPSLPVILSVVCPPAQFQQAPDAQPPRLPSAAYPHCPPLGQLRGKDRSKSAEDDGAPPSSTLPGKMEESDFSAGMEIQLSNPVTMLCPPVPVGTPDVDENLGGKRSGKAKQVVVQKKRKLNQNSKEVPEPAPHSSPTDKIIMPKDARKLSCGECNEDILKPNHFG